MTEPRLPDTELDAAAQAKLAEIMSRPSHPTAAKQNLARTKAALREKRALRRAAISH